MAGDCNLANVPEPTLGRSPQWQFSLRELLFVTVVVALHLAAFAIIYQYIESNKPRHILPVGLASGIGALLGLSINAISGRTRAGRSVLKLRTQWRRTPLYATTLTVPSIVLASYIVCDRWLGIAMGDAVVVGLFVGLTLSVLGSGVILLVRSTRLCESGIVQDGLYFCPWTRIRRWSWNGDEANQLTIGRGRRTWTVIVPPEQRAAVEALLKEKLGEARPS